MKTVPNWKKNDPILKNRKIALISKSIKVSRRRTWTLVWWSPVVSNLYLLRNLHFPSERYSEVVKSEKFQRYSDIFDEEMMSSNYYSMIDNF